MLEKYCAENWPGEQGASPLIVKGFAPDTWLSGLRTVTEAEPATAMSAAGMLARTCIELNCVVDRALPFQRSWTPDLKPSPSAMSVKAGPPAVVELGVSAVRIGSGRVVIGNPTVLEKMPPGLRTWTE